MTGPSRTAGNNNVSKKLLLPSPRAKSKSPPRKPINSITFTSSCTVCPKNSLSDAVIEIILYLEKQARYKPESKALVFDIDATLIKVIDSRDRTEVYATKMGVVEMTFLFKKAKELGFKIYLITARPDIFLDYENTTNYEITRRSLRSLGFSGYTGLALMPYVPHPSREEIACFKRDQRARIPEKIILTAGDQWTDLLVPKRCYDGNPRFKPNFSMDSLEKLPDKFYILKTAEGSDAWALKLPYE